MLILSRKQGEKVLIEMAGETIEVIVQENSRANVTKLAIVAPMKARIMRAEIANELPGVAKPASC